MYFIPWEIANPQSEDGGCEPRPRKLSVVVDIIVPGRFIDTKTIIEGITLGNIYLNIMEAGLSQKLFQFL